MTGLDRFGWLSPLSVVDVVSEEGETPERRTCSAGIAMQAANVNVGPPADAGAAPLNRAFMAMSNSKFLRDSMLSLSIPTRDADYYISDGNTVLLVENILFKVRTCNLLPLTR
jgi:hypothetical protein